MPTPEELVAYLHRVIKTAEHQDELEQVTNPILVKDIHHQMGQMVLILIGVRNAIRTSNADDLNQYLEMIDQVLKGEL